MALVGKDRGKGGGVLIRITYTPYGRHFTLPRQGDMLGSWTTHAANYEDATSCFFSLTFDEPLARGKGGEGGVSVRFCSGCQLGESYKYYWHRRAPAGSYKNINSGKILQETSRIKRGIMVLLSCNLSVA